MRRVLLRSFVFVTVLLICNLYSFGQATVASATKIGNPTWEPAGFVLFSAPIGTSADSFAAFSQTEQDVLPAPNHVFNNNNGQIAPGAAHAGPYDTEMSAGVTNSGFKTGTTTFNDTDFSGGNGIFLAWMFIPSTGAPTGASPDSADGPIIPNSLFALGQTGLTQRDGVDFDPNWDAAFADVNTVLTGLTTTTYQGYSHLPFFEAEAAEFGPGNVPVPGNYSSAWTITDLNGDGWTINTSYIVTPEPASIALFATAAISLIARRARKI